MENYILEMNNSIKGLIKNTQKITNISFQYFLFKTVRWQRKAIKKRKKFEIEGTHVPPFLIASITSKCNLHCKGCYAAVNNKNCKQELPVEKWDMIFKESSDLGISFILLAGGEPFIREDLIYAASKYPEIIFPVFTNATLINEKTALNLKKMKNIIPVISIEGTHLHTDNRRGPGISEKTETAMDLLKNNNIFYGLSLTVTRFNFDTLTNNEFINKYINKGCKLFFYVEYVPLEYGTEDMVVSQEQRIKLDQILSSLRQDNNALFIDFPGDEKKFGGCLSSGRGFIHINANGALEPCPFSPYSDTNLNNKTLKEALNSKFLKAIRDSQEHLSETEHGCALFNKQEWVQSLLQKGVK